MADHLKPDNLSGFRMVLTKWLPTIRNPDKKVRFSNGFNKMAAKFDPGFECPGLKWSGYRMVGTGIRSNPKAGCGPAFGCLLYSGHEKVF
jgi:hypothetical protein